MPEISFVVRYAYEEARAFLSTFKAAPPTCIAIDHTNGGRLSLRCQSADGDEDIDEGVRESFHLPCPAFLCQEVPRLENSPSGSMDTNLEISFWFGSQKKTLCLRDVPFNLAALAGRECLCYRVHGVGNPHVEGLDRRMNDGTIVSLKCPVHLIGTSCNQNLTLNLSKTDVMHRRGTMNYRD